MSSDGSNNGPDKSPDKGLDQEDRDFITEWMPKIGGAAVLFFTMILLASHPKPGSIESLIYGLSRGVPAALVVTIVAFLVLLAVRKNRKK